MWLLNPEEFSGILGMSPCLIKVEMATKEGSVCSLTRAFTKLHIGVHACLRSNLTYEPVHEISNNLVCATREASDQPAHMRSLIRAFASRLSIL